MDGDHILRGRSFKSFEEFEAAVKEYERSSYQKFYKISTRSIASARKKGVKRLINDNLRYYEARYSCIKGGRDYQSKATQRKSGGYVILATGCITI
jgi:hypothetical protein